MWKRLISASLTFGLAAAAPPAFAQAICGQYEALRAVLTDDYGESVSGRGLQSETRMIELWRSPETGSWTLLMILPSGMGCILASGTDWQDEPKARIGTSG
ncbi:MAG: hypothetical protein ACRCS0_11115 [Albidovulum sp.]